jgi:hypothetical protein
MHQSGTTRFLAGKILPLENPSPVRKVIANGTERIVVHEDSSLSYLTKRRLKRILTQVMAQHQFEEMSKTMVRHKDGSASITLGGHEKGDTKKYSSPAAAMRALRKHYKELPKQALKRYANH